jgi:hypothetical protein
MTTNTTTATGTAPGAERDRLTLGRERLIGAGVVVAAAAVLLLAAQVHHWIAPRDSDGAAGEILPVLIGGALGWLVVFGAALIPPHRAADTATVSRRYALGFGLFAVPMVVLAYWTPIPWCLGVASLLLLRRARTVDAQSRRDLAATGLAWVAIVAPLLIFGGVVVTALH